MAVLTFDAERKAKFQEGWKKGEEIGFAAGVAEGRKQGEVAALKKMKADAEAAVPVDAESMAKAEWEKSPELRDEFPSLGAYVAYRKADEAGRVRIFQKK